MTLVSRALAIACLAGLAGSASAALTDVTITGALNPAYNNVSLELGSPRTWVRGADWSGAVIDASTGAASVNENWIGMSPVTLDVHAIDGGSFLPGPTNITITKSLQNNTAFAWTSFTIDLLSFPGFGGPVAVNLGTETSSRFSSVLTSNISPNASMVFSLSGADTPVLPGETVSFGFVFNITGDVAFRMVQTPVPTPGVLALVGLGGMVATRRRR